MSEPMNTVLEARGLAKTYREGRLETPVFDGLELSVAGGETVAIIGASGAGKSTLLHLLGGLDTPTSGEVFVDGQSMTRLGDAERRDSGGAALAHASAAANTRTGLGRGRCRRCRSPGASGWVLQPQPASPSAVFCSSCTQHAEPAPMTATGSGGEIGTFITGLIRISSINE